MLTAPVLPSDNRFGDLFQPRHAYDRAMNPHPEFKLVCVNCGSLGIILDFARDAPASTQIRCGCCNAPRGTLGDLRVLAGSNRRDLFDLDGSPRRAQAL